MAERTGWEGLRDRRMGEPGAREAYQAARLAVDVRGEHPHAARHPLTPPAQESETGMRPGRAVQPEPMTVESPRQLRVTGEVHGVGKPHERQTEPGIRRVRRPEAGIAAEVRQPRVHSHAGAGAHQQRLGVGQQAGRRIQRRIDIVAFRYPPALDHTVHSRPFGHARCRVRHLPHRAAWPRSDSGAVHPERPRQSSGRLCYASDRFNFAGRRAGASEYSAGGGGFPSTATA